MPKRRYITTAIDYPNALPHLGHVLEKVLADVCVRWYRLRGDDVRFQIGADEHGIKIERTAKQEGITPEALVDRNVPKYQDLYRRLGISADAFVRTTDRIGHWPTVEALWKKLLQAGALEKRSYTGLYCQGCERFLAKRDLQNGLCPIHNAAPEEVTEENWFLLLKREEQWLKKLLTGGGTRILPAERAQETLALLESGLEDVSFSRPVSSLTWGIPVPDDPGQVMYVWCDALTNYISGLDIFGLGKRSKASEALRSWWEDAEVTHVIGKDIARFHALIWPAMLRHAGLKPPERLLIHGFLTSSGQKMSKSIGNVVDPETVLEKFNGNPDPLRFALSQIPVGRDGDFSWERITELYDGILRNELGNLLNRVLVLLRKENGTLQGFSSDPGILRDTWTKVAEAMDEECAVQTLLTETQTVINRANKFIDERKPWSLPALQRQETLGILAETLRHIALLLHPVIPTTASEIARQLSLPAFPSADGSPSALKKTFADLTAWGSQKDWKNVGEPRILFTPLS